MHFLSPIKGRFLLWFSLDWGNDLWYFMMRMSQISPPLGIISKVIQICLNARTLGEGRLVQTWRCQHRHNQTLLTAMSAASSIKSCLPWTMSSRLSPPRSTSVLPTVIVHYVSERSLSHSRVPCRAPACLTRWCVRGMSGGNSGGRGGLRPGAKCWHQSLPSPNSQADLQHCQETSVSNLG